ncbi:acetyl-CoA carboxylase biotin carboxylase subunit [Echinicola jeungdonensis]|uniref:Acetyl/propionyl/methylcrotonyl-CoA carboxylase subunit alpha n=1 Tax=Echinicola jeungdonensis TaxID=709343 RepID=A0ABV5J2X6_9BACT|nr:acetyl-CoA carboxylase biotin carboxylase subunit [Echinicola jeungdonensis]MDN3668016.1 acetyl-CoA carboxylase biotin carboxylase subunit [Echinicola jeungdonensis]
MVNKKIKKILVANRGEIALRIMRTAREMGIRAVAVYSEADRKSPHVRFADEAVFLGPSPSSQSYLNGKKIVDYALKLKVDGIHPGYGFLSENSEFAQLVEDAGLIFIGPSSKSIQIMGDKLSAKKAVSQYKIPMIPGTDVAITDLQEAKNTAKKIGYPILIKASAGGGGKGMRVVEKEGDLENQLQRAISEAKSAFGNPAVFLEKYISSPRHIEIQILGDQQGHMVYLFERECSIQRRHQKVIEEAPSPVVSEKMRKEMGVAAIKVAKSCHYHGAGTVEFIVDEELNFYFLEMNTRLQVEHPVTEMITGKDLVKYQILIAEGRSLDFGQEDLTINGHAIEVRVYAEDPQNNFLPDIGKLRTYKRPQGPGVRVDDGFEEGLEIPIHYDPMIAKLVVHDENREKAIQRMIRAVQEYQIAGLETTLSFARFVMEHPCFQNGNFNTKFIELHFRPKKLKSNFDKNEQEVLAAIGVHFYRKHHSSNSGISEENNISLWKKRLKDG